MLALMISEVSASETPRVPYEAGKELFVFRDTRITESSGLAMSRRLPGGFWTHNDSGDSARLFLVDEKGQTKKVLLIDGALARDWEDMASYELNGIPMLLIGDVGDNRSRRKSVQLYFLEEPVIHEVGDTQSEPVWATLDLEYEGGARDCESVAVDPVMGVVYLADKRREGGCNVFRVPLPRLAGRHKVTAVKIGEVGVPFATGMDVSPDGTRMVFSTYLLGFEYDRKEAESWPDAFKRVPRSLPLPVRKQGESIAYAADGMSLVLSSEKAWQPVWILRAK